MCRGGDSHLHVSAWLTRGTEWGLDYLLSALEYVHVCTVKDVLRLKL